MATYSSKFRVFQSWGVPSTGTPTEQNVFVFGPKYSLHRYTDEDEKAEIVPLAFESNDSNITYDDALALSEKYKLDSDSFEMFAEDAYVRIGTGSESGVQCVGDYLNGVLFYPGVTLVKTGSSTELAYNYARSLEAGDYIAFKSTVDDAVNYHFVRIAKVEISKIGESTEYGTSVEGTQVTLETGAPDGFFDADGSLLEDVEVFGVTKFKSTKLNADSYGIVGVDVVMYTQISDINYAANVAGEARPLVKASIYPSYRALETGTAPGIEIATSMADVENVLGKADPANPLSMGVFNAFVGGAQVVYYYRTSGEDVSDFEKALDVAELNPTLYYLVPMSQNKSVLLAVADHVKRMSTEETKRWRIMVVCSDVPDQVETQCKVTGVGTYTAQNATYVTLKFADGAPAAVEGDILKVGTSTFEISKQMNNTTLLTSSHTGGATGAAVLYHKLTATEYAKASASAVTSYSTFRVVDVFPKTYGFDGKTYSSMYAAPIIAGLKAHVVPQAPISNTEIPGVDDLPEVYSKFTAADLDTAAAGGNLIMMQDMRGEPVYVRRQLTAGTKNGILAQTELSMVTNFDFVSKYFDSVILGFRGAYNVTPSLINIVANALKGAIYNLEQTEIDKLIGPNVLTGSRVVSVKVDPANATRIIAHVVVVLPAPFNEMDLYLSVDVTTELEAETSAEENA